MSGEITSWSNSWVYCKDLNVCRSGSAELTIFCTPRCTASVYPAARAVTRRRRPAAAMC